MSKRIISVCMVLMLVVTLLTCNVSAAVAPKWVQLIRGFRTISEAKRTDYPDYTKVLQMCLVCLGNPYASTAGGSRAVDGIYGTKTGDAVELFQQNRGLSVDRVCGPNTWGALANEMDALERTNGYTYFSMDDADIMMSTNSNPYQFRYYQLTNGTTTLSNVFHTGLG